MMRISNAERQRRYVARLKARAEAPHSPPTNPGGVGPVKQPPKQRLVKVLLWKAEGIPRCHHPSYEASAGKGSYRIGPVFDFQKKFAGYSVHHQANKSNFKNIRAAGFAPTAEAAKAIAQRDYDQRARSGL
jgi:hypothetical protein